MTKIKSLRFNNQSFTMFYVILALLFLFYTSGSIYNTINYKMNGIVKTITCILLWISFFRIGRSNYAKIGLFVLIGLVLALVNLINKGDLLEYVVIFVQLLSVYLFYLFCNIKKVDVLYLLYKFCLICAGVFFVCFLLFDIGPLTSKGTTIIVENAIFTNYYNIYYRWHDFRKIFGLMFNSCNGFFSEPGLYMIWLHYGLIYELFIKEKTNYFIAVFFALTVITTSTMGAILLCGIVLVYLYFNNGKIMRVLCLIPLLGLGNSIFNFLWNERINSRIESVEGRVGDIYKMLEGIIEHPIIGNGTGTCDTTNSFFLLIYEFGLLGFLLMGFFVVNILKSKKDFRLKTAILMWLTLSLFNQPILYHNLFFFVALNLYSYFRKDKNKTIEEI